MRIYYTTGRLLIERSWISYRDIIVLVTLRSGWNDCFGARKHILIAAIKEMAKKDIPMRAKKDIPMRAKKEIPMRGA